MRSNLGNGFLKKSKRCIIEMCLTSSLMKLSTLSRSFGRSFRRSIAEGLDIRVAMDYTIAMERDKYKTRYSTVEKRLLYSMYSSKRRAKKENIEHTITYQDLTGILNRQKNKCYYTGLEFSLDRKWHLTPTIDRIDCDKGYTPDNIVIASCWANRSKFRLTESEFQDLCWKVCENV